MKHPGGVGAGQAELNPDVTPRQTTTQTDGQTEPNMKHKGCEGGTSACITG